MNVVSLHQKPELTVICNNDEEALKAYFRRLYMIEKHVLQVMIEADVQVQYRLIHTEIPRSFQGRVRFNGGMALGFNPYSRLPCAFYTPLGAIDISRGFSTRENAANEIAETLTQRLGLIETTPVKSIVPGISQRVFIITRDPSGNKLPRAEMMTSEQQTDKAMTDYINNAEDMVALWDRVRLHQDPTLRDQILLSLPRNVSHLKRVA